VVARRARRGEEINVPAMQQIEDAVREDDRALLARTPLHGGGACQNTRRRTARRQKSPSACGLK
jgi:hypothetical protein